MIRERAARWRGIREGAWGVLAGLTGSLCCIGPSAAILLGLGSSSALFGLQVNQTLALGAGVVLLLVGGLLTLRGGRACDLQPRTRWGRIGLMVATGTLVYGLLGVLTPLAAIHQEHTAAVSIATVPLSTSSVRPANALALRQATLLVDKMDCPPCVAHLRSLLAQKSFIARYTADDGNEQVTVVYDSHQINTSALLALIPAPYQAALHADAPLP